jgi:hypothetical protein
MLKYKIGDPVSWKGFNCEVIKIQNLNKKQYLIAVISQIATLTIVVKESDITPA